MRHDAPPLSKTVKAARLILGLVVVGSTVWYAGAVSWAIYTTRSITEEKLARACEIEIEKDQRFTGSVHLNTSDAQVYSALKINAVSTTGKFERFFIYTQGKDRRSFTCFGRGSRNRIHVQRIEWNDQKREP